jgi:taurine dioxygenase
MNAPRIRPLGYALGAEVTGVDATRPLDDRTVAAIRRAWLEHIILCFPGQDLEPEQLKVFCEQFGELNREHRGTLKIHPDQTGVMLVSSQPISINGKPAGGIPALPRWHTDESFKEHPAAATFLLAKALPAVGGDTMFANMYMAYETLSPALREILDGLQAVQDRSLWPDGLDKNDPAVRAMYAENPPVAHPIVQVHPETGRKSLYVDECKVRNIVGMTEEETKPLIDFLVRHATRYELVYRHRWAINDLVMWDNRCSMHLAVADYDPRQTRCMMRCNAYMAEAKETVSQVALASRT